MQQYVLGLGALSVDAGSQAGHAASRHAGATPHTRHARQDYHAVEAPPGYADAGGTTEGLHAASVGVPEAGGHQG